MAASSPWALRKLRHLAQKQRKNLWRTGKSRLDRLSEGGIYECRIADLQSRVRTMCAALVVRHGPVVTLQVAVVPGARASPVAARIRTRDASSLQRTLVRMLRRRLLTPTPSP